MKWVETDFLCIYIFLYKYNFHCSFIGNLFRNAYIFLSFVMTHLCVMPDCKTTNGAVLSLDKSRHCRWSLCTLLSSICLGGVSDRPLQTGCFLYTGVLNSQRQVPAPHADYLKRMSEWWRKVVKGRVTEQELLCFGIRMCYSFSFLWRPL